MGHTPSLCLVALLGALALCLAGFAVPAEAEDVCPLGAMRPDAWVADLVARLRSIGMVEDRVAYLKQAVLNDTRSFTGKQIGSILSTMTLQQYTLQAMSFLQPYISGLTTDEFIDVLLLFLMEDARLAVLPSIKDTLFNASEANKQEIVFRCFGMSANRQKAIAILTPVPSRDCVFGTMQEDSFSIVIDASASSSRKFFFNGKAYTRMSFVVEHLNKTLSQLKPTQMFYIISFDSGPFPLFRQPVYATPKNIEYALGVINRWGSSDSTVRDCYGGLYAGFAYNPTATAIYFVSTGAPSAGTPSDQVIYASIPQWNQARSPQYQARVYATALIAGADSAAYKQAAITFMSNVAGVGKGVLRAIDTQ